MTPPAEMKLPLVVGDFARIKDATGRSVAAIFGERPSAKAAFLVASVNRHAELVEALRKCIEALEVCEESAKYGDGFPMIAHEAMDKAKALTEPATV